MATRYRSVQLGVRSLCLCGLTPVVTLFATNKTPATRQKSASSYSKNLLCPMIPSAPKHQKRYWADKPEDEGDHGKLMEFSQSADTVSADPENPTMVEGVVQFSFEATTRRCVERSQEVFRPCIENAAGNCESSLGAEIAACPERIDLTNRSGSVGTALKPPSTAENAEVYYFNHSPSSQCSPRSLIYRK